MSPQYAANTDVSTERSRGEIERTLQRYGAEKFAYGWDQDKAIVQFYAEGRYVKFLLALPDKRDRAFTHTPGRELERTDAQAFQQWEQACRQRWRALSLVIKAKLEAVEAGISEFEEEFLANIVLPSGQTAGDWLRPQVADAYESGKMPPMLAIEGPKRGR